MIFAEALDDARRVPPVHRGVQVPVLANITEFGKTPLFTMQELAGAGVRLVLYPLSAFRAMTKAAENVYGAIAPEGTQKSVIDRMQTRDELYEVLGYLDYEQKLDELFVREAPQIVQTRTHHERNETSPPPASSRRNPSRSRASPPATPPSARSAAPATTCTTAATTSSTSPTTASSRRSRTCWCTASCRTRRSSAATRPS